MADEVILFAYGTLRQGAVQRALFGRLLESAPDALAGYALSRVADSNHTIAGKTGNPQDRVPGMALRITEAELEAADAYEPEDYVRVAVRLKSGAEAFVYVKA